MSDRSHRNIIRVLLTLALTVAIPVSGFARYAGDGYNGLDASLVDLLEDSMSGNCSGLITVQECLEVFDSFTGGGGGGGNSVYVKDGASALFNNSLSDMTIIFNADDFSWSGSGQSRTVSIDYTNGQAAASGVKGFLTGADWDTFNAKVGTEVDPTVDTSAEIQAIIGAGVYQTYSSVLDTYAGINPAANVQAILGAANYAAMRTLLDLEAGTDFYSVAGADAAFQPLDSDLTSWAGVTRAAGFDTFAATPSSANLASLLSGETGSGAVVFGTSPTIATPVLTLEDGNGAAPTTDGRIKYDRTAERLQVGDGTGTSEFIKAGTLTDTKYCTYDATGKDIDCNSTPSGGSISSGTSFPGSPSTDDLFVVTDDSAAGACDSAAGSARSLCQYNGSSWVPVGDGGTGSDTNSIWQVSGPVVSLIPKLAPLGETDGIAPNDKDSGTYTNYSRSADDTADETVGCWKGFIPADINSSGNAYFGLEWYSKTATTGAVQWYAVVRNRTQGGSWDAIGTKYAASSETTQGTVDQSTFTFWSVSVSTIGWTANYETEVCFNRDGDGTAGTDSMTGDAQAEVFKIGADRA